MRFFFVFLYSLTNVLVAQAQSSNINLSNTLAYAGEPYIAVNPINPQNLVVAWMAADLSTGLRVSIKTKTSFDGGLSWGNQFIQPHFSPTWGSADVSMQFAKDGSLYLSYIDYRKAPDSGAVYITHSNDGGINWSVPTASFQIPLDDSAKSPLDRPWLARDNSSTANSGMTYITTKPPSWVSPPNRPYLKTSSDNGNNWTAYRYIDTTGFLVGNIISEPMPTPTVTADGALSIVYPSYLVSQSPFAKFIFAKSYDRGNSFSYTDLLVNFPGAGNNDGYKLGYKLAANPANANQLAFLFVGALYGDPDIFAVTTNDGGKSWAIPVRVNDDTIGIGKAQDMVWGSYSESGILVVSWRDRRNGTDTGFAQPSDTYCAISRNNGKSFQSNIRLSDSTAPFASVLANSGNDFMSCSLVKDSIYAAWSDVRNGKLNIYFAKSLVNCYKNTWTGAIDSAWEHPGNWSCNKVPDENSEVTINGGRVIVSSVAVCHTLTLNPAVNFIVNSGYGINIVNQ